MGARNKLNANVAGGAIFGAAVLGFVCESWVVFILTAVVLVSLSLEAGDIRLQPRQERKPPQNRQADNKGRREWRNKRRR